MHQYANDIQRILSEHRTTMAGDAAAKTEATYPLLFRILAEELESDALEYTQWNKALASCIDHTLLRPDATPDEVETLCEEARLYNFAGVCVPSSYLSICSDVLQGSAIAIGAVIGFPLGSVSTPVKIHEVEYAAAHGATEFDMVLHAGHLKAGNRTYIENDIARVVETAKSVHPASIVKVILETCQLTDEEKVAACLIAKAAKADFVKTSTGFGTAGATTSDVALLRCAVGSEMGVKASGGILSFDAAVSMLRHGANRIGTSNGMTIIHHSHK